MAHWEHRDEPAWRACRFGQPYAKGLRRLREEVLAKTDFDPAVLWQWGTTQAIAVLRMLQAVERRFGKAGQETAAEALREVGLDVGRQILQDAAIPEDLPPITFISFYTTIINRIVYASLEAPRVKSDTEADFDILWCPHQDTYGAFDCRVQRYFVQGMIDAAEEKFPGLGFQARFDSTIPAGAPACHFTVWRGNADAAREWAAYTRKLDTKALEMAQDEGHHGGNRARE